MDPLPVPGAGDEDPGPGELGDGRQYDNRTSRDGMPDTILGDLEARVMAASKMAMAAPDRFSRGI